MAAESTLNQKIQTLQADIETVDKLISGLKTLPQIKKAPAQTYQVKPAATAATVKLAKPVATPIRSKAEPIETLCVYEGPRGGNYRLSQTSGKPRYITRIERRRLLKKGYSVCSEY